MVSLPLSIAMVLACLALVGYVLAVVRKALYHIDGSKAAVRFRWVGIVALLWLVFTAGLGYSGFIQDWNAMPPRFLAVIVPMVVGWVWLALHPAVGQFARTLSLRWLTGVQTFRFAAEAFIWFAVVEGAMPELLTFHGAGRNFDILTPILASVLAVALPGREVALRRWVWAFNVVGLALLVNVVAIAILSSPQFLLIPADPPNAIFAGFPGVWLPAVMVWLAGALHILSIRNLRQYSTN